MEIAGFIKNSFLDYPGKIAAVLFTPGCNMDCWYCHNRQLWAEQKRIDADEIDQFLDSHKGFIDGVVISGGEPTLQPDLVSYIRYLKDKGYVVKLDTNGLRPDVLARALPLLDYVAMDLKAPRGELNRVVSFDVDETLLDQSAALLMAQAADYEFRTTVMPMLRADDIEKIAQRIKGAKKYALQQYRKTGLEGAMPNPLDTQAILDAAQAAEKYVQSVVTRGI